MLTASQSRNGLMFLMVCTALLRLWQWQHSPIEHFDEGVYASNFWFDAREGFRYPDLHLYAPPLLPTLIEWGHLLFGPGTLACLWASLLAGIATTWLIWKFLTPFAGRVAGLAAAGLWTFQELPILYSRTALTESLLCWWMLLAVLLAERIGQQLRQSEFSWQAAGLRIVGCGLACGLAWLTKYNGWLSVAIIVSAGIASLVFDRWPRSTRLRFGCGLLLIAGIAGLIWSPYWQSLQQWGGYAAVAENHRRYFVGVAGWGSSLVAQLENVRALIGLTSLCGLLYCLRLLTRLAMTPTVAASTPAPDSNTVTSTTFPATSGEDLRGEDQRGSRFGYWMIASWWIGLSLAIPLYYPYPRLLLPWILASCLGLGVGCGWLAEWLLRRAAGKQPRSTGAPAGRSVSARVGEPMLLAGIVLLAMMGPWRQAPAWQDRRALQQIAGEFIEQAGRIAQQQGRAAQEVIFYVYGEPALFYHLSAGGRLVGPIGHLDFAAAPNSPPVPTFLVTGPHAAQSPLFAEQWEQQGKHFELVAEQPYRPSLFIRLNRREEREERSAPVPIKLYQVRPPRTPDL